MTINLTDLKALAEAATPGEWQVGQPDRHEQPIVRNEHIEIATLWHHSLESILLEAKANAAYIAAASPTTMLPLINALIEWRDARRGTEDIDGLSIKDVGLRVGALLAAEDALVALITEQETNNDAG